MFIIKVTHNFWKAEINTFGEIKNLFFKEDEIKFRNDDYAGPSILVFDNEISKKISFEMKSENNFVGEFNNLLCKLKYTFENKKFSINFSVENNNLGDFKPERLFMRFGIDHFMIDYPQWDSILFPTLLRCEKTHFWGYMMSPLGKILTVCSNSPVKSWKLDYNRLNKDHNGHRIYTSEIDFLNTMKQPERHPNGFDVLKSGEKMDWTISFEFCEDVNQVQKTIFSNSSIPFVSAEKYTLSAEENLNLKVLCKSDFQLKVTSPDNQTSVINYKENDANSNIILDNLNDAGVYKIELLSDFGYISTAYVYKRMPWSYYLKVARKETINKPQQATTHLEGWYGFHSAFLAAKHFPDEKLDNFNEEEFLGMLFKLYDEKTLDPIIFPGRICNSATTVELLIEAYYATNKIKYVEMAEKICNYLVESQAQDGSYRAFYCYDYEGEKKAEFGDGNHYTAVLYIAKAVLLAAKAEKSLICLDEKWETSYKRHYNSVEKAIANLCDFNDNITTEGEITFEDGMITCSALQLAMFALELEDDDKNKQKYLNSAELLIKKHRCLEQMIVPDCRINGGTIRFWEAQYDVLFNTNMINSPHGWTSWKNYATWYLYLLTGKKDYLKQTMDTIGACMQTIDLKNDNLRWSFICDPCVKTGIWVEKSDEKGAGVRDYDIIGEQYIDMISGWWRPKDKEPVGAYLSMPVFSVNGILESENIGGCCDNDVHEHFKCLEEIALTAAYVIYDEDGIECWNCSYTLENNVITIYPNEDIVNKVHINSDFDAKFNVSFKTGSVTKKCKGLFWIASI